MKNLFIVLILVIGSNLYANPSCTLYTPDGITTELTEYEVGLVVNFTDEKIVFKIDTQKGSWRMKNGDMYIKAGYWTRDGEGQDFHMNLLNFNGYPMVTIYNMCIIINDDIFILDEVKEGWYE